MLLDPVPERPVESMPLGGRIARRVIGLPDLHHPPMDRGLACKPLLEAAAHVEVIELVQHPVECHAQHVGVMKLPRHTGAQEAMLSPLLGADHAIDSVSYLYR